jgi:hypothetical protein
MVQYLFTEVQAATLNFPQSLKTARLDRLNP